MNWRLYSIFTTQVKCSAKRDILKSFFYARNNVWKGQNSTFLQLGVREQTHRASANILCGEAGEKKYSLKNLWFKNKSKKGCHLFSFPAKSSWHPQCPVHCDKCQETQLGGRAKKRRPSTTVKYKRVPPDTRPAPQDWSRVRLAVHLQTDSAHLLHFCLKKPDISLTNQRVDISLEQYL